MSITTTEKLNSYVPRTCDLCGAPITLGVKSPTGAWICEVCPDNPPAVEEPVIIGHDPLDTTPESKKLGRSISRTRANSVAVSRAQRLGVKFLKSKAWRVDQEIHQAIGYDGVHDGFYDADGKFHWNYQVMYPAEKIAEEAEFTRIAFPLAPGEVEELAPLGEVAPVGAVRSPVLGEGQKPLSAKKGG